MDSDEAAAMSLLLPDAPTDESPSPEPQEEPTVEEEPVDDVETEDEATSEDEAEEPEVLEEPQLFTVKVDGVEQRVTLEELTRSFSGEASIKRRIQEAELSKREAEAVFGALQSELQQVQAFAQQVQAQGLKPPPTPPDPRLAETNPAAYVKALATFDARSREFQAQQAQLQAIQERQSRVMRAAQDAYVAEQARALAEAIPDFAKPETATAARDRLVRAAADYGYTPEEVGGVMDARAVRVLHDAAQWRAFQAQKAEAAKQKPPAQAPRHVPPAAKRQPEPPQLARAKQIAKARKSGNLDAFAALLLNPDS